MKQFELRNGQGETVLGPMGEDNVYLTSYPSFLPGEKKIADLEVGESSRAYYSLSGQKKTLYYIVRTE